MPKAYNQLGSYKILIIYQYFHAREFVHITGGRLH